MAIQSNGENDRRRIILKGMAFALLIGTYTGGTLFLSAGRFDWWQAWVLAVLFAIDFAIWVIWGARNNPELLMERANSLDQDVPAWDKIIVRFYTLLTLLLYVVAGLDYGRYHWSALPLWAQNAAFIFVLLGELLSLWALTNNPFASGVVRIQKERGHTVSKQGPYAFIRHPMYAGTFFLSIGVPIFLGSWWAFIPGLLMISLFVARTLLEDRILFEGLTGYQEYSREVRYRCLPGIW